MAAFGGWEGSVGVDLAFEAFEELIAARLGACTAVGGLGPGDVCAAICLLMSGTGGVASFPRAAAPTRRPLKEWGVGVAGRRVVRLRQPTAAEDQ